MPKNTIIQQDNTGSALDIVASNTVFIPIETIEAVEPTLCNTIAELDAAFTSVNIPLSTTLEYSVGLGYKLAKHLLKIGLTVLAQGVTTAVTEAQWTTLQDKNLYNIRFLTNGAIKSTAIVQDMIDCAAVRGDCTAIVDFDESASGFDYTIATIQDLVDVVTDGAHAAAFTPAFYSANSDFTADPDSDVLIPAELGYIFAYANSIKSNPEWFAVAGFERGIIPELSRVKHKYTTAEVNTLQRRTNDEEDNVGIAINAISYVRPAGFVIYGNRTLKNNDAVKGLTATSFLNVRNMISVVSKVSYEAANRVTFEQNTETLWVNYKSYIEPTLDRITHSDGAFGYSINKIKTNKKATLKAEIIIQPVEAVEDIELTIVMTDTSTVVAEQ